jgi:hypothetical protein
MLTHPPFVKEAIERAVASSTNELERLDNLNAAFSDGVFIGKAKDLPIDTKSILLDAFSLRRGPRIWRAK